MFNRIIELAKKVLDGQEISFEEAMELARAEGADIQVLAAMAAKIREKFAGDKVDPVSVLSSA